MVVNTPPEPPAADPLDGPPPTRMPAPANAAVVPAPPSYRDEIVTLDRCVPVDVGAPFEVLRLPSPRDCPALNLPRAQLFSIVRPLRSFCVTQRSWGRWGQQHGWRRRPWRSWLCSHGILRLAEHHQRRDIRTVVCQDSIPTDSCIVCQHLVDQFTGPFIHHDSHSKLGPADAPKKAAPGPSFWEWTPPEQTPQEPTPGLQLQMKPQARAAI